MTDERPHVPGGVDGSADPLGEAANPSHEASEASAIDRLDVADDRPVMTDGQPGMAEDPPADAPPNGEGAVEPAADAARPADATSRTVARLAHIHLALGMHGLARAELETLAARGALDVPALADLAEVRWRTGDLVGAGDAAEACLQAEGDALVVLCIAAEAASAAGRAADARQLAARVLARGRDRLDELFAGQPRGPIWPPLREAAPVAALPAPDVSAPDMTPTATMSGSLAEIQARVARAELAGTATRLGLVLRTRPALAPAVLAVADEAIQADPTGSEVAGLHLVRGDAYRLMGRETLAAEAFQQSSRSLRLRPAEETS
ncbi:MAG: hypothetical protein M0Z49_10795 [Chloroflexi bacterium]|nr:hypothetical protein [Chloroflexota bacterium]